MVFATAVFEAMTIRGTIGITIGEDEFLFLDSCLPQYPLVNPSFKSLVKPYPNEALVLLSTLLRSGGSGRKTTK